MQYLHAADDESIVSHESSANSSDLIVRFGLGTGPSSVVNHFCVLLFAFSSSSPPICLQIPSRVSNSQSTFSHRSTASTMPAKGSFEEGTISLLFLFVDIWIEPLLPPRSLARYRDIGPCLIQSATVPLSVILTGSSHLRPSASRAPLCFLRRR